MNVPMEDVETVSPVIRPGRRVEVRKTNPRKNDPNHVTIVSIQYGVPEIADSVKFGILSQVLKPAAYDELRTNQQLGYVVQGGVGMTSNVLHASVMVQGATKLPDEIEPQIEMVLTTIMEKKLKDMTEQQFNSFKDSFAKDLLEPPLGFSEEIGHYWTLIARNNECPDKQLQLLQYLREQLTSKHQLVEAWNKIILPDKPRSKVVVKYFSDTLGKIPAQPTAAKYVEELKALKVPEEAVNLAREEFKTALLLYQANSSARHQVLMYKNAHFYPRKLKCHTTSTSSSLLKSMSTSSGGKALAHKTAFRSKNHEERGLDTSK